MKRIPSSWVPALLAVVSTLAAACTGTTASGGKALAPPGTAVLRGAGATFPALLYKKWFAAYQEAHPEIAVSYDVVGSGEGVRRFIGRGVTDEDKVDFGASDSAMTDEQLAALPEGARMVPVTAGSLVLAYNIPGLKAGLRLSRKAYAGIFLGEVTDWSDPLIARANPGVALPRLAIALVVRSDSSGTTYAFTNHLAAMSDKWRSRYGVATMVGWPGTPMRASGNEGVAGRIKLSTGSIGYVNYGSAQQAGLPMAILENKAGEFVEPTAKSAADAIASTTLPENLRAFVTDPDGRESYPIVTLTWILLHTRYDDTSKAETLADLLRWCLSDGQKHASALRYVPLPGPVAERSLAALAWISTDNI